MVIIVGVVTIAVCDGMTIEEAPSVKVSPPIETTTRLPEPDEAGGSGSGVAVMGEEKTEKEVDSVLGSGSWDADSGDGSEDASGDGLLGGEDPGAGLLGGVDSGTGLLGGVDSGAGLLGGVDSGCGIAACVDVTAGGPGAGLVGVGIAAGGELGLAAVVSAAGLPSVVVMWAGGRTVNEGAPGPFTTGVMA